MKYNTINYYIMTCIVEFNLTTTYMLVFKINKYIS